MVRRLLLAGMLLLGTTPVMNASAASPWEPLVAGDTVTFLVPVLIDNPTTHVVVFSGGTVSEIDLTGTGCGFGTRPVQHYVVIDPTGTRSERLEGIIPQTTLPVRPGTGVGNLTFDAPCSIDGVLHFRFSGTVQ